MSIRERIIRKQNLLTSTSYQSLLSHLLSFSCNYIIVVAFSFPNNHFPRPRTRIDVRDLSLGIFTPISINYLPSINFWTVWWLRLESSRNETHNLTFALPFAFTSKTWQVKYDCYLYCYYWSYEMFYRLFPLDEYRSRSSLRSLCQDLDRYQRDWTVYLLLIDGHEENLKLLSFQS